MAAAVPAQAEYPSAEPYVGLFGGGQLVTRTWDIGDPSILPRHYPGSSGEFGARLGWQLLKYVAVEAGVAYLPTSIDPKGSASILRYDIDVLWHILPTANWTPFVLGGLGAYHAVGGDLGKDVDPQYHLGVGVRGLVLPWLALRADLRSQATDGPDAGGAHNISLNAGVDVFFGFHAAADRDGDGIADSDDKCPDQPGDKEFHGCRAPADRDHDGIADVDDKCPDQPGVAELQGCPKPGDKDGDGVIDAEDKCPDQAGDKALQGCPKPADQDGDGILDADDKCPDVAGPKETAGCPDKDKDGVADKDDKCPDLFGTKDRKGCPDRDNDGVLDADDKCPDKAGVVEEQGCMPKALEKFTGVIQGILFDTGKHDIKPESFPVLEEVVKVMGQFASLRLEIQGHTDNVGHADDNHKLSHERANAVRDWLIAKGIDHKRLVAEGYGDKKPIADNATEEGRAKNRRIEFVIISKHHGN